LARVECRYVQAEGSGLMADGPELMEVFRRAADYVNRTLRDAALSTIPVE
jgi:hypothetical protein